MKQLLEAGVHYGHVARKWNPKMAPYIFGERDGIHIMNLDVTVPMLQSALEFVEDVASKNGRILFVGTKQQASEIVKESAVGCGQYYVNHRWLGGMLTNWETVSQSVKNLKKLEEKLANPVGLTKKEVLSLERKIAKLNLSIGGIINMGGIPDAVFVIDVVKEKIAVSEALKLGIKVVAIVDSNACPDGIPYPIPGNIGCDVSLGFECQTKFRPVRLGPEPKRFCNIWLNFYNNAPQSILIGQSNIFSQFLPIYPIPGKIRICVLCCAAMYISLGPQGSYLSKPHRRTKCYSK
jgi:small subunit ribosomal protein S2